MTPEQLALLEAPFEPHELETTVGQRGTVQTSARLAAVIRRLNQAFKGHWSSQVTRLEVGESAVIAVVRLVADGVRREQVGIQPIARSKDGAPLDLAADGKAAVSQAFRNAARLFGIGLSDVSTEQSPSLRRGHADVLSAFIGLMRSFEAEAETVKEAVDALLLERSR